MHLETSASNVDPPSPLGVSCVPYQPCSAEHSVAVARLFMQLLLQCCWAGSALLLHCWVLTGPGSHLIQPGLSSCPGQAPGLSYAVLFTFPQAGLMCRKCYLMQETLAAKTSLQYLWCKQIVFQLNDFGMNSLLPPFLGTSNVYVIVKMHWDCSR